MKNKLKVQTEKKEKKTEKFKYEYIILNIIKYKTIKKKSWMRTYLCDQIHMKIYSFFIYKYIIITIF